MFQVVAFELYKRALKLTPKADVEDMRKLEAERFPSAFRHHSPTSSNLFQAVRSSSNKTLLRRMDTATSDPAG